MNFRNKLILIISVRLGSKRLKNKSVDLIINTSSLQRLKMELKIFILQK